jgi:kinesin family protein 26
MPTTASFGSSSSLGKVKVVVRVANSGLIDDKKKLAPTSFFRMDKAKRQVTLFDPACGNREKQQQPAVPSAPKMFAFDALFTDEDAQAEVCASALTDSVQSVVNGTDGCVFCYGHANLGKSYTMVGSDESGNTLGVIPAAIAWLFR